MSAAPSKDFVISRVFNAPRDLLWKCLTKPEHLSQWWGAAGVKIVKSDMDFRVGGTYHYGMQNPDGQIMWGRQVYREITPPERIVLINSFSDEAGGLGRHPLAPQWPLQIHTIFTFEEEPGGRTRFTVHWSPYEATAEEQAAFDSGHQSMTMGWGGVFDKLDTYLARMQQQQQQQ